MKKKLYFVYIIFAVLFLSCEEENKYDDNSTSNVNENQLIVNHFVDIVTEYYPNFGYVAPKKLNGGEVIVYFHESLSNDEKEHIRNFYDRIQFLANSVGSDISFSYTEDSSNGFKIGIVHGDVDFLNDVFGTDYTSKDTTLGKAFSSAGGGPQDCMLINESLVFINDERPSVLFHELGHTIGLEHTNKRGYLMTAGQPIDDVVSGVGMNELDEMVVKLLYYVGDLGDVMVLDCAVATSYGLNNEEIEDLKNLISSIIDNDYQ